MADPNAYVRRDDVDAMLRDRMNEMKADAERMTGELAATGDEAVGELRKQYLASQIAATFSEIAAVRHVRAGLDKLQGFTYRSFTQYDGMTRYNSLVDTVANRVPLDPVVPAPATIAYVLTVTRKADGETRERTGEMAATSEGLRDLWWTYAEGSMGSDCNHDILFGTASPDDDVLVDEPETSAYAMELKLADGTIVDLTDPAANDDLARRLGA